MKGTRAIFGVLIAVLAAGVAWGLGLEGTRAPYPRSTYLKGLKLDWSTFRRLAPGSDNWPLTWAADGNQYTAWGDGGGFGGTNALGRVSLGVARVEGPKDDYRGVNVYGGANCEVPSKLNGKTRGLLALGDTLYMWVEPGSTVQEFEESRLYVSYDHGRTWKGAEWAFKAPLRLAIMAFCQFGKGYEGARDEYVYVYAPRQEPPIPHWGIQRPGHIDLLRVTKDKLLAKSAYEIFAGFDESGKPKWSKDFGKRRAVFSDPNGVGPHCSVSYNAGLKRYLLATEHTVSHKGNLGLYEAPEPWGPWRTVEYWTQLAPPGHEATLFYLNFSNKWCSKDGRKVVVVLTGSGYNDAWESVEGEFVLKRH